MTRKESLLLSSSSLQSIAQLHNVILLLSLCCYLFLCGDFHHQQKQFMPSSSLVCHAHVVVALRQGQQRRRIAVHHKNNINNNHLVAARRIPRLSLSSRGNEIKGNIDDDTKIVEDGGVDLFDYFDPLLSPHMYPNGISPDHGKPVVQSSNDDYTSPKKNKKIGFMPAAAESTNQQPIQQNDEVNQEVLGFADEKEEEKDMDLFDYFDPLLSPHSYPNGISPNHKPPLATSVGHDPLSQQGHKQQQHDDALMFLLMNQQQAPPSPPPSHTRESIDSEENPLIDLERPKTSTTPSTIAPEENVGSVEEDNTDEVDLFDYFDPLLSPHSYPNGINPPSNPKGDVQEKDDIVKKNIDTGTKKTKVIGVLLMDHGSRSDASNERIHHLARIYEETQQHQKMQQDSDDDQNEEQIVEVVVRGAHMEIAEPSIPQAIQSMIDNDNVDEIVCHPYFLSPGRHVMQDIPDIIRGVRETIDTDVPINLTDPVGLNTDFMITAIHKTVKEYLG